MLYDVEMNDIHLNICLVIVVLFGGGIGGGIAAGHRTKRIKIRKY